MRGFTPLLPEKTNLLLEKPCLLRRGVTGFTLIEVLVSVLILGLLVLGIYQVLEMGERTYSTDMGLIDLHQQVRQGLEAMVKELREAQGITITVVDTNSHRISFDTIDESSIQYYRDTADINADGLSTQIIREYPSGTRKVLANNISKLNFCCLGGSGCTDCASSRVLQITVQADKTVNNRPLSFSLTEEVNLRNESG